MKKILLSTITLLLFATTMNSQVRIKMQKENGVYTTPCVINGLRMKFVFDTGASNVSMSLSEALFMLKNGYLEEEDIHGSSYSQIANGEIVENTTVNLKELEIGGIKIHNVEASIIHELSAPLLLGQSAIQKLGRIQFEDDELVIISHTNKSISDAIAEAEILKDKARKYYLEELYALSADLYQKAHYLSPDLFTCLDMDFMGTSYFYIENYPLAIKYLEKAAACEKDHKSLYYILTHLSRAYCEIVNYQRAILNIQRALSITQDDKMISSCYFYLGFIHGEQKKHNNAIDNYEKRVDHYLKYLSTTVNEIMKGKIKDVVLGETYYNLSILYYKIKQENKGDSYMIKSALCGDEDAIISCKKYDLKFELYLE